VLRNGLKSFARGKQVALRAPQILHFRVKDFGPSDKDGSRYAAPQILDFRVENFLRGHIVGYSTCRAEVRKNVLANVNTCI